MSSIIELLGFGGQSYWLLAAKLVLTFFVLGLTYLASKVVQIYFHRKKYKHLPGPPLEGILDRVLGLNFAAFDRAEKQGKAYPDTFLEWRKKYGDTYKTNFFHDHWVFTTSSEAIKEIFITKDYPKDPKTTIGFAYPQGERFIGQGLVTELNYQKWRHRRAIFNPGFHRHVLMTFVNQFNQKADTLMERLRTMADGKTCIKLYTEINHATLDAIALIAFGMTIDSVNEKDLEFSESISYILRQHESFDKDPFIKINTKRWPEVAEFKKKIRYLREVGRKILADRVKAIENDEAVPDDILTNILKACKDEELDVETMIDDFITFFIAGQETTANTLAFCFIELGRNPHILQKVKEEVDRVIGERQIINFQDIAELKYCSGAFKEALRLWPPVPVLGRRITEKMNIDGQEIPADTFVIASTYVNARDENYFKDPYSFRPERFFKEEEYADLAQKENYVYFPFSLGPRNCIGQNFAQIEGVIMIAKLVQRFDFKLDPNQSFDCAVETTMRPKDGTKCYLSVRSDKD